MPFYPVSQPDLSDVERRYILDAFDSSWISSSGRYIEQFEESFAKFAGCEYALGVANGTVALHLALEALEVGPGDEVIVPSLTYIATANAVRYCGADVVFADVDERDWGLSAAAVEAAVTARTKAIIAVHLYGQPANMVSLRAVATRHNIALIEDAAEAPGAQIGDQPIGSLGDVATFSFYGNKIVTSGEGGAVTTSDQGLAAKMKLLRGQGMDPDRRYWFPIIGYNYRMTNLAAAILCGQLERFQDLLSERMRVCARYDTHFSDVAAIELQARVAGTTWTPWLYCVSVDSTIRDGLMEQLSQRGVDTRPFFIPLHTMPPYRQSRAHDMTATNRLASRGFNLPTYPALSDAEVDDIATILKSLVTRAG